MAPQNKLTDAYLPDKSARKEKVIIGLSGGTDSLVAAYLLKIQKYDLIAVTVAPAWEELGKDTSAILSCTVSEKTIEKLQAFTHQLGIPHFVVRIPREFRDRIVERWMVKRAQGEISDQCWNCHELRMVFLHQKMKELGGKYLATGHFAKVFRHEASAVNIVQTSNDETHDQSVLLSRLPQEILQDLMLPLSDLQKKEVLKLAENFGVSTSGEKIKMFDCFPMTEETTNFLKARLPERFRLPGGYFGELEERYGDHEGIILHHRGEEFAKNEDQIPLLFFRYHMHERKILVRPADWFKKKNFVLRNCRIPPETPWLTPFRGILMKNGITHEGWFLPKSVCSCAVELDEPLSLIEGETLSVLKKKGKNARVLLSGVVVFVEDDKTENEDTNAKIDYGRDF